MNFLNVPLLFQFKLVFKLKKKQTFKLNKKEQQRVFNTFVRESINQLLGNDYMRTHDVQDIDAQVMEMIRSKRDFFSFEK